ncbi:Oxygen-independent coproporphyrinogen III oxidase [compost metagenome]
MDNGQLTTRRGLHCNNDDRIRRAVIQQLICHFRLDFAAIEEQFNIDFRGYFNDIWPTLESAASDGLIRLDEQSIDITAAGRLLVRSVCMLFDSYLPLQSTQRFSRVI